MPLIKINLTLLYLLAFTLLWVGYSTFVTVVGFIGFAPNVNVLKIIESIFLLFLISFMLPSKVKKPSDFLMHIHFLLPILPMLVLYGAQDLSRKYILYAILAFTLLNYIRKFQFPNLKEGSLNPSRITNILFTIVFIYISSIIYLGGLNYINFNLLEVYNFRSAASDNLPGVFEYFSPLTSKVILPFILVLSVYNKKMMIAVFSLSSSILMFALTSHKGPLFYPIIVLIIYFILNKSQNRLIYLLIAGYALSIAIPLIVYSLNNAFYFLGGLTFRRVYFVPALLNFFYYDFFSTNPHTLLSESKLTFGLVDYPYSLNSSRLIAYTYTKGSLTTGGANTGWLGSSYMNFGFSGMLIYSFIIGLVFSIVDSLSQKKGIALSGSLIFTPFFVLFISADLPTAMLNHGMILALFLVWVTRLNSNKSIDQINYKS